MAALPAPRTNADLKQAAERLAARDKIPYAEAHRRISNSLTPRPTKSGSSIH